MSQGKDAPEFGSDYMNKDHQAVLTIVTRLEKLLNLKNPTEMATRIDAVMQDMVEFHRQHFDHEDQQMEQYEYPEAPVHQAEHRRVLKDLETEQQQWLQYRDTSRLNNYIFRKYTSWLLDHLVNMDVEFDSFMYPLLKNNESDKA